MYVCSHECTSGNISIEVIIHNFLPHIALPSEQLLSGGVAITSVGKKIFSIFPKRVFYWFVVLMRELQRQC